MGFAIAKRLLARGVDTMICAYPDDQLQHALDELTAADGGRCAAVGLDLLLPDSPAAAVAACLESFGGIDILVNNAGFAEFCDFGKVTVESWERSHNLMARAPLQAIQAAVEPMAAAGGGRVVNNASISASLSEPGSAQYSAAKAAVVSITKTAAVDLARYGIRANAIAPGWIRTPLSADFLDGVTKESLKLVNPLARVGDPDEVAAVAEFLALDAPDFLTGETIH